MKRSAVYLCVLFFTEDCYARDCLVLRLGRSARRCSEIHIDAYEARDNVLGVSLTIGDQSIQVPKSYTPEQDAAFVTLLKDKAADEQPTR